MPLTHYLNRFNLNENHKVVNVFLIAVLKQRRCGKQT